MSLFGQPEYVETVRLDPAFESFKKTFEETMNPARYGATTGDYVQLARLRRILKIQPKATPPDWERACMNYMSTPMGGYSLKDLCARYAVFVRSPLDRYSRPVGLPDESR